MIQRSIGAALNTDPRAQRLAETAYLIEKSKKRMATDRIPTESIEQELANILESAAFADSPQLRKFLAFVVRETLAGRDDEANSPYAIATKALGRPDTFNADEDPLVRVHASRLREKLNTYYLTEGAASPVRVLLPRRGYRPMFEIVGPDQTEASSVLFSGVEIESSHPVVAIYPCRAIVFDAWEERFCRGLNEHLVLSLSRYDGVEVMPLEESREIRQTEVDFGSFSRKVRADFIIVIDKIDASANARIVVKLIGSTTGTCLWTKLYEVDCTKCEISMAQADIAGKIAARVAAPFGYIHRNVIWQSCNKNVERLNTYECLMQATLYYMTLTVPALERALRAVKFAMASSPGNAFAHSILAALLCEKYRLGLDDGEKESSVLESSESLARRALLINPDSAHAHLAMSCICFVQGRPDHGRQHGELTLLLNPKNKVFGAEYGLFLANSGDWSEGMALVEQIVEREQNLNQRYLYPLVSNAYCRGDFKTALSISEQLQTPDFFVQYLNLAKCHGQLGNHEEGKYALKVLQDVAPGYSLSDANLMLSRNFQPNMVDLSTDGLRSAGLS